MNPISNTAFYCCGVRMDDARRKRPVCNDIHAHKFMDPRGLEIYQPFRAETMPNISNISRCRIIDDEIASALANNTSTTVITIGAGFDTRPYRLDGGNWIEFDEPQIIEYKNDRLPVTQCANSLTRVPIDFARDSLLEKLAPIEASENVVVVVEGVFMYLDAQSIENTLRQVQQRFSKHLLLCDLMTRNFFDKFAQRVHAKLVATGGHFSERPDDPTEIFRQYNYRLRQAVPMFERASEVGVLWDEVKIPAMVMRLLLNVFMKDLQGYAVHRFDFGS